MKVAITGAHGFVGQNLHRVLKMQGITVVSLSRPQFDLHDLNANIEKLKQVDVLVHCAAHVHQMKASDQKNSGMFRHVNVHGTRRLMQAARIAKVKQVIFLSSIKVNGEQTLNVPFGPDDVPAPQDPYAVSKYQAELLIQREFEIPYTIIRAPLIYGPGMKGNLLRLIRLIRRGTWLPLGSLQNRRSFLHVFNLCQFIQLCLLESKAYNQVFTLSDNLHLSTSELIVKLGEHYGRPARLLPCPKFLLMLMARLGIASGAVRRLTSSLEVDNSKAVRLLNWQPQLDIGSH